MKKELIECDGCGAMITPDYGNYREPFNMISVSIEKSHREKSGGSGAEHCGTYHFCNYKCLSDFASKEAKSSMPINQELTSLRSQLEEEKKHCNDKGSHIMKLEAQITRLREALVECQKRLNTYVRYTSVPKSNSKWSDQVTATVEELDWMRAKEAVDLASDALALEQGKPDDK